VAESPIRWRLADDDGGKPTLFKEELECHPGTGEFRGMEFLHVRARRIINEVPAASRMPFQYTINAYRGCSHSCSYCADGDTQVLLANGRSKPLGEVSIGDEVFGTEADREGRRLVRTVVLDHWSTVKPALRVALDDQTVLTTSADHRLLTPRGWVHVGDLCRQTFLGEFTGLSTVNSPKNESLVRGLTRVAAIDVLDDERSLYDITTGTGDFIANGVVSHNCFARPTHQYLNMNAGEDFEKRIVVKVNAVERLRAELASKRWQGDHIAMGTNTDPYQRCEGKYRLTRGIIKELGAAHNPFSILTKGTLILRDLDVLTEAAKKSDVRASFSIGTLDEEVWRASEPGTPHPRKRVEAVAKLNEAGIPCGVLVAPILPGLSDSPEQLEEVVKAVLDAGAVSVSAIMLHLRPGVREQYMPWLEDVRPDLVDRYTALYPRSYAPKSEQEKLSRLVSSLRRKYGDRVPPTPPTSHPRTDRRSAAKKTARAPAPQLPLGL
jgi:DNA repair photolyase